VGPGVHFRLDLPGRLLAVLQFPVGLLLDVVDEPENQGRRHAHGQNGHEAEGDRGERYHLVSLLPLGLHLQLRDLVRGKKGESEAKDRGLRRTSGY